MFASLMSLLVVAAYPATTDVSLETVATDDVYRPELVSLNAGAANGPQITLSLPWMRGAAPTSEQGPWLRMPAVGLGSQWSPARARGLTLSISPQLEFGDAQYAPSDLEASVPLSLTQTRGIFSVGLEAGRTFANGGGDWASTGSLTASVTDTVQLQSNVAVQTNFAGPANLFGNVVATWTPPRALTVALIAGVGPSGRSGVVQALGLLGLQFAV